ncbi:MAG: efflux RND transporter periplasmic adaptor subunit [Burkholderiales bacterium]|nr:efflux RND transporter periplasmic adaptor subunit [Burkholderiales bacterium]
MSDFSTHRVSRGYLWTSAVVFTLVVAGIVINGLHVRSTDAAQLKANTEKQALTVVSVISPTPATEAGLLSLPGRFEAPRAPIYARVSGYLKSWKTEIGTPVKAGQLLAEIDTPDLDQQILQAKAELATTQANAALSENTAKRWKSLEAANFVSSQAVEEKVGDYNAKLAAVNASQANVNRLLSMKNFARIVSPFDGVVTARNTEVGALINTVSDPGRELFVVTNTKRLRLYVSISQNQVLSIRQGSKAKFTVPSQPGKVFTASVVNMSQAINSSSGSMLVQLAAENARDDFLSGGFASVSFDIDAAADRFTLPPSALIFSKAGIAVATVNAQNKVELKTIVIARDHGSKVEILSGIQASDKVIENPPDGVAQGDVVQISTVEAKH